MKILLLTNEYPPYVYGGAGIHVEHLSQELSKLCSVEVRSFGDQEISKETLSVKGFKSSPFRYDCPEPLRRVFDATQRCLDFNSTGITADIVHVHTWYTHLGGILAKMNYGIPLVVTVHSLEPLRPWKKEQLGGGYDFSCWVEKTAIEMADAVIAVSEETRQDILKFFDIPPQKIHVIHNGVDPDVYKPVKAPHLLSAVGVDPKRPFVLFMGRITRQKGIIHLVRAIRHMKGDHQIVLCASSPDTPEIAQEMTALVEEVQKTHPHVLWLRDMMDTPTKIALYSHAAVFCCPSIYEPFGIINIEAMACETPVVA
ncbi:MAG: glycogen synthase, partial [Elusimicrobia bacterium]|nr:glycogen synthase [Elusimicrobiota bacterium]